MHIPSDSSGFIELQSIVKLQKSTRRVSQKPYMEAGDLMKKMQQNLGF
jgi:hypothetical protein